MDGKFTTRVEIKDLNPSISNILIIGIIIAKRSPKKITIKKNDTEKSVWSFTLRDSASDFVNVTVWGSEEYVRDQNLKFYPGNVVEVINPRIAFRNIGGRDSAYVPDVTSSFCLTCDEGQSEILVHEQNCDEYFPLLRIPTKRSDDYITLRDAQDNGKMLADKFLNFLVVVRSVGERRQIKTKLEKEKEIRDVTFMDKTLNSISFTVWDQDLILQTNTWKPRRTTLFLADFKIEWNKYKRNHVITSNSRSIITENPSTDEAKELAAWAYTAFLTTSGENVPYNIDPKTINNAMSCNAVEERAGQDESSSGFTALVYALVYYFDLDGPISLTLSRCEYCNWRVNENDMCTNTDCPSGSGTEIPSTLKVFNVAINLTDHTGCLINCKLNQATAASLLQCSASDFEEKSDVEKTSLKWQHLFKHVAARLHVLPGFREKSKPTIMVLSCDLVPLDTYSVSVPMF